MGFFFDLQSPTVYHVSVRTSNGRVVCLLPGAEMNRRAGTHIGRECKMVLTDYKFVYISRFDDGTMQIKARIYEGDITSELSEDVDGNLVLVVRYRRTAITKRPLRDFIAVSRSGRLVESGNSLILSIDRNLTNSQLIRLMNTSLALDPVREPIDEQKNR